MHKAFVLSGVKDGRDINGIFFTTDAPNLQLLNSLGIENISVSPAKPLSAQPFEPTLYLFRKNVNEVEVIRFDWCHTEVNRIKASGAPYEIIPPVGGESAEKTLYAPSTHLIKGMIDRGTPVLGILAIKPKPGESSLDPTPKILKKIGITQIKTFERVTCEEDGIIANSLYLVERSPSAHSVTVKTLSSSGEVLSEKELMGDPMQLLPCVSGSQIDRLFKNGLTPTMPPAEMRSSIPPVSSRPPSSKRKRRR